MSANCVLYNEDITRAPAAVDLLRPSSISENLTAVPSLPLGSTSVQDEKLPVPPRREYVWRTIDRGPQSLATVARRITLDLDMNISPLRRFSRTDGRNPHRCAGYIREEITLATTTLDSAVVTQDTPTPREICSICGEVVGLQELFRCMCGDQNHGSRHTIKCQVCNFWSHSDCVGSEINEFICQLCVGSQDLSRMVTRIGHLALFNQCLQKASSASSGCTRTSTRSAKAPTPTARLRTTTASRTGTSRPRCGPRRCSSTGWCLGVGRGIQRERHRTRPRSMGSCAWASQSDFDHRVWLHSVRCSCGGA
ncbi:hypothetical protein B0H19DRAFT_1146592 [Mycena capillaripes]|nr:hypothetical protein B0H19DRAFT_1146592 [Mycena capillaripes]